MTALSGARLDRELRRVVAGRRDHRATVIGRAIGKALLLSAALCGLAWITIASVTGIVRILFGV